MGVGAIARLEERMLGELLLTENDFFFYIGERDGALLEMDH